MSFVLVFQFIFVHVFILVLHGGFIFMSGVVFVLFIDDRERDKSCAECTSQYIFFIASVERNLRDLGIIILQMINHKRFDEVEIAEMSTGFLTAKELLVQFPKLYRFHGSLLQLLILCFEQPTTVS